MRHIQYWRDSNDSKFAISSHLRPRTNTHQNRKNGRAKIVRAKNDFLIWAKRIYLCESLEWIGFMANTCPRYSSSIGLNLFGSIQARIYGTYIYIYIYPAFTQKQAVIFYSAFVPLRQYIHVMRYSSDLKCVVVHTKFWEATARMGMGYWAEIIDVLFFFCHLLIWMPRRCYLVLILMLL